jgi:hypothetical protein
MISWLKIEQPEQRMAALRLAQQRTGVSELALEKDWWITLTLRLLFLLPYASFFTFKGGTSLSKAYRIINRFSEDIDIALDPRSFGIEPESFPSKSKVERLRRAGCEFTTKQIKSDLQQAFELLDLGPLTPIITSNTIPPNVPDQDPQTLFISYPSLLESNPYLQSVVKVEFGIRSSRTPRSQKNVNSLIEHALSEYFTPSIPSHVWTLDPASTFQEKILLLHEEYHPLNKRGGRTFRMSRHWYDLVRMVQSDLLKEIWESPTPFQNLRKQRACYSPIRGLNKSIASNERVQLIPPDLELQALKEDYALMRQEMIFGDSPTFEELTKSIHKIQQQVNMHWT